MEMYSTLSNFVDENKLFQVLNFQRNYVRLQRISNSEKNWLCDAAEGSQNQRGDDAQCGQNKAV